MENNFDNIKFLNIFSNYDVKKITEQITSYTIYKDFNNLITIDNFICELYNDLSSFCSKWKFKEFVKKLFTKHNSPMIITYASIFNDVFMVHSLKNNIEDYIKFFEMEDFVKFEKIILKYSKVKLTNEILPIEPSTQIVIEENNFNLSNILVKKLKILINSFNSYDCNPNTIISFISNFNQNKLKLLFSLVDEKTKYDFLKSLLFNDLFPRELNNKINKLINETNINFINEIDKALIFIMPKLIFVLSKIIVINETFENFNKILDIAYSLSNISFIEMINILKPELLDINLIMLKKILYYGRFKVFEKLYWEIPWKVLSILEKYNPFYIGNEDFNYIDDIYDGKYWDNDECDKIIIGTKQHAQLFKLIMSIAQEKNFTHICWTDEIKSQWVGLAIEYNLNNKNLLNAEYFVSYAELKEIFGFELDFTSKKSIKQHILLFGKANTWKLIKSSCECNEDFLDLLFD